MKKFEIITDTLRAYAECGFDKKWTWEITSLETNDTVSFLLSRGETRDTLINVIMRVASELASVAKQQAEELAFEVETKNE